MSEVGTLPLVIYFMGSFCPMVKVERLFEQTAKDLEGKAVLIQIDLDEFSEISEKFGVDQLANFTVLKDGTRVFVVVGYTDEKYDELVQFIKSAL